MDPSPTIAIVGRPNVGKSTLFNRLIGKRHAIEASEAGTTRDRITHSWECEDYDCILVDTGGLEYGDQENIEANIQAQANIAISGADLIFFVINAIQDLTVDDFAAADILRKSSKPVILVANKCDNHDIEQNAFNFYELGFGEPVKISAIHKMGIDQLTGVAAKRLKDLKFKKGKSTSKTTSEINNLCIVGKPNAGKSSLVNALFGDNKVIVSDIAGTTRDSIDTEISYKEQKFNLIDTAGLRRRGKIEPGIEKFSSFRCFNSIQRSDIVILLIDGEKGITSQDCHIAQFALEADKGLIIAINKIDLLEMGEEMQNRILGRLKRKFAFVPWAPVIFVSAKNKKNTYKILDLALNIMEERKKRIETSELNSFLQKITFKHMPASHKARKPKFFYGTQADISPPKFVLFFKNPKDLHFSYPRYLENEIRKEYGFNGTAIQLKLKNKNSEED